MCSKTSKVSCSVFITFFTLLEHNRFNYCCFSWFTCQVKDILLIIYIHPLCQPHKTHYHHCVVLHIEYLSDPLNPCVITCGIADHLQTPSHSGDETCRLGKHVLASFLPHLQWWLYRRTPAGLCIWLPGACGGYSKLSITSQPVLQHYITVVDLPPKYCRCYTSMMDLILASDSH